MNSSPPPIFRQLLFGLIGIVLYFCLSLGLAWILLARTGWLANKLSIRDETGSGVPDEGVILRTGVKLIGLYVTIYAIPGFTRAVLESGIFVSWQVETRFWTKTVPAAIQLGLGLFFTFKSGMVLEWITRDRKNTAQSPAVEALDAAPET